MSRVWAGKSRRPSATCRGQHGDPSPRCPLKESRSWRGVTWASATLAPPPPPLSLLGQTDRLSGSGRSSTGQQEKGGGQGTGGARVGGGEIGSADRASSRLP